MFSALALAPEDTQIPLPVLAMMCEASSPTGKRPPIVSIRRWLRALLNRNLILGTVDRIQLHDLVRDYIISRFEELAPAGGLRGAHRRLLDILANGRPTTVRGDSQWEPLSTDEVARYVNSFSEHHTREGLEEAAWENDTHAIEEWLGGVPQDSLCVGAARALGLSRLLKLVASAESRADWWGVARWQSLAAEIARIEAPAGLISSAAALPHERAALDALSELRVGTLTSEMRAGSSTATAGDAPAGVDNIEMHALSAVLKQFLPEDSRFHPRVARLLETPTLQRYPEHVIGLSLSMNFSRMFDKDSVSAAAGLAGAFGKKTRDLIYVL